MHMITKQGPAYKHVRVKPTLTRTKSDPNDPDNPDDPTQLQRWLVLLKLCDSCLKQSEKSNIWIYNDF